MPRRASETQAPAGLAEAQPYPVNSPSHTSYPKPASQDRSGRKLVDEVFEGKFAKGKKHEVFTDVGIHSPEGGSENRYLFLATITEKHINMATEGPSSLIHLVRKSGSTSS